MAFEDDELRASIHIHLCLIVAWLETVYPEEGCGLLVQTSEGVEWVPTINVSAARRTSFEVDPAAVLAQLSAENRIVCVVHSHVNSSSDLSIIDKRNATYEGKGGTRQLLPGARYLVISINEGKATTASEYEFESGGFGVKRCWDCSLLAA